MLCIEQQRVRTGGVEWDVDDREPRQIQSPSLSPITHGSSSSSSSPSSLSPAACPYGWWSGAVLSTLALINEVNVRRTRLVLRWGTVSGSIPGVGHLFQYVINQLPKANSAFHPPGSVNEYQLRLGRQRQVWFIPLADERGVCR